MALDNSNMRTHPVVFMFEIIGVILGWLYGFGIYQELISDIPDLQRLFIGTFVTLYVAGIYVLIGMGLGFLAGYVLHRKELGLEIGILGGFITYWILVTSDRVWGDWFVIPIVFGAIGWIAGKIIGSKFGIFFVQLVKKG